MTYVRWSSGWLLGSAALVFVTACEASDAPVDASQSGDGSATEAPAIGEAGRGAEDPGAPDAAAGSHDPASTLDAGHAPSTRDSGGAPGTDPPPPSDASAPAYEGEPIAIELVARVGDAPFDCTQTYDDLGTQGHSLEPRDLRFYLYGLRLLDADGGEQPVALEQDGVFQHRDVALLDFEDGTGGCSNGTSELHTTLRGFVPAGDYVGIAFELGVPEDLNHANPTEAASPLNLSGMHWSWNAGYKFVRFDGMVKARGSSPMLDSSVLFHLGSTLCTGSPVAGGEVVCERPNRPTITLPSFDARRQRIAVDYAALLAGVDLGVDQGGAPGCMSGLDDPECVPMLASLGFDHQDGEPQGAQTVFVVEDAP